MNTIFFEQQIFAIGLLPMFHDFQVFIYSSLTNTKRNASESEKSFSI